MTEREKVINDLIFMRRMVDVDVLDADGVELGSGLCIDFVQIIDNALMLLKAQEPDETRLVRHYSRPNVYADLWLHCEKCGGRVDNRYKPKFCPECGRKVKWE